MKKTMRTIVLAMFVAVTAVQGYDNPVEGGSTQIVTNDWQLQTVPWLYVGSNTDGNTMVITNGGTVDNQVAYIGGEVASSNNQVLVTGNDSVWSNTFELNVGLNGSSNTLGVGAGGRVETQDGYVGRNSGKNTVLVTDEGSVLDASQSLYVGDVGSSNSLMVANGGRVESANGAIGYWIASDGNTAAVQGTGSVWSNAFILNVGEAGSGNQLVVLDGGRVESSVVNVGVHVISTNNLVAVSGEGALLDTDELYIGGSAAGAGATGNRVEVGNGGTVATESLNIYSGNSFDLNDGGTLDFDGDFDVSSKGFNWNDGGHLSVSGQLLGTPVAQVPWITASVLDGENKTLTLDGGTWVAGSDVVVGDQGTGNRLNIVNGGMVQCASGWMGIFSSGNTVLVEGSNSLWSASGLISIGNASANNSLVVENAGMVEASTIVLGGVAGAKENQIVVSGTDAKVSVSDSVRIGVSGDMNALRISGGGMLEGRSGYLGLNSDSDANKALVTGANSVWANSDDLFIGSSGSGNYLTIEDGGRVENSDGYIGYSPDSGGNSAVVTGADSVWLNSGDLAVGFQGSGNSLAIEDGGQVTSRFSNIGFYSESEDNSVLVSGADSAWISSANLHVGFRGSGNRMVIEDGGRVESQMNYARGYVGGSAGSDSNSVLVTGSDSSWDAFALYVGYGGSDNSLTIEDGGYAESDFSYLGVKAGADDNSVLVSGAGSTWVNKESLYIGSIGSGNSLIISDGGRVESGHTYGDIMAIGDGADSDLNSVRVSGVDSALELFRTKLYVGDSGSHNTLVIENGGLVNDDVGFIGFDRGANSNSVVVTGENSVWNHEWDLSVGMRGAENTLTIADGGRVNNFYGLVGRASDGNSVLVTGNGSVWDNSGEIFLGQSGSGNSLRIENGGLVENTVGIIGYYASSDNNSASVTGQGSVWSSSEGVLVGREGAGNTLLVSDGGAVVSANSYIGYAESALDNAALVSGGSWNNEGSLVVGLDGSDNRLSVMDGGSVESLETIIGAFSTNNSVLVSGDGSFLNSGNLSVGNEGSGNSLSILNGGVVLASGVTIGTFSSNNVVSVSGEDSVLEVEYDLYVGYEGGGNTLLITDGGRVGAGNGMWSPGGVAVGLTSSNNSVIVSGSGSSLSTDGYFLLGGDHGFGNNTLEVSEGASVHSGEGYVGGGEDSNNNAVFVAGAGSTWQVAESLFIGSYYDPERPSFGSGSGNKLVVSDGGRVTVGEDFHNRNSSVVSLDPGSRIDVDGNYYQDAESILRFGVETNAVGEPLNALMSVDGTAEFEAGATLQYHSNVGVLDFGVFYTNLIVEADQLIVGGIANPNALDLEAINLDGSLVDVLLWEDNQNIYGLVDRKYLAESAGFAAGTQMAELAREIDDLSLLGHSGAGAMINQLNGMSSAQQNVRLTQLYERGAPNYKHIQGMTEGMDEIMKYTGRHQPSVAPQGAAGPHRPDQGVQGWVKPYGVWADYSAQDGFSAYNHNVYGTVVGMDRREGDALVGLAGGFVRSNLKQDDGDVSKAETGYGVLYASWGTKDWFGDVNMAYGRSGIDQTSGTAFGNTAEFDAHNYALYLGGGKEVVLNEGRVLITPKASMLLSYYYQEGYTEESDYLPRDVAPYDRGSALSSLGASFAYQIESETAIIKPEARLYWLHEFNADVDAVDFTIAENGGQYHYYMPAALEDVIEAGLGISCKFNDELGLEFDVDGRLGEDYSAYAVSGRAVFEF